jgi:DNA-binding LacI/PurR family transcriptional regulator
MVGFTGYGFERRPRLRYWTLLQEGIEEVAAREGKGVVLLDQKSATGWDRIDGILFSDVTEENVRQSLNFATSELPRVSLLFSIPGCDCVISDEYEGGRVATRHLLELGHRRIAYLSSPESPLVRRRLAGYRDALQQAGITSDPRWERLYGEPGRVFPNFIERSTEVMRAWLADDWQSLGCTAILATNDQVAAGILIAFNEAGVEVPGQVSIVGYDNSEICDYLTPRLTSVHVPLHRVGSIGMEKLLQQIGSESQRSPVTTMLLVELIKRSSTSIAAG